ncbi:elongation of very long chain fatty acids protein 6-like [Mercenaria mercenaria]|uniref:elongation of very long chain fatty acids protein 6-like n=1 Tax=Mercenaria mercenaria TaxID=6596 RepID=UPI00234F317A|nr:elongation of very long chain fatty acids protein 6-like [Mercenaria mercenaria]
MDTTGLDPINMSYVFSVEKSFDTRAFYDYMLQHWSDSLVYSAIYLVVIFGGKAYMANRKKFELRPYLAVWSGLLAVYSILGTIRTVPELIWALSHHGFEYSYCNNSYLDQGKVSAFWCCIFVLSKAFELGDTLFIVLRKQPLIFLHWYHHITVLVYSWSSYTDQIANARYFVVTNYTVHSFMYSYYALRAMKFQLPKWVSMFITSLQLAQMAWGVIIVVLSFSALTSGRECVTHYRNICYCLLMYFSYLILFAHFFYNAYVVRKQKKQ